MSTWTLYATLMSSLPSNVCWSIAGIGQLHGVHFIILLSTPLLPSPMTTHPLPFSARSNTSCQHMSRPNRSAGLHNRHECLIKQACLVFWSGVTLELQNKTATSPPSCSKKRNKFPKGKTPENVGFAGLFWDRITLEQARFSSAELHLEPHQTPPNFQLQVLLASDHCMASIST